MAAFNDYCSICLEPLVSDTILFPCKHILHIKCTEKLYKHLGEQHKKCPLCRQYLEHTFSELCSNNNDRLMYEKERERLKLKCEEEQLKYEKQYHKEKEREHKLDQKKRNKKFLFPKLKKGQFSSEKQTEYLKKEYLSYDEY